MTSDEDIRTFLRFSSGHMDVNGLGPNWESEFVRTIANLRVEELKLKFRRGFAKSVLGQLTPKEYERATSWDFDTEDEFREHLRHYWKMFYGDADPADSL